MPPFRLHHWDDAPAETAGWHSAVFESDTVLVEVNLHREASA